MSRYHLFQLSDNLLLKSGQIRKLQEAGGALFALLASFLERALQVLHRNIVRRAGISLQDLDDGGAIVREEEVDISVVRPDETVHFKALFHLDHPQPGLKRRRIVKKECDVTEDEQVAWAIQEKKFILVAKKHCPTIRLLFS